MLGLRVHDVDVALGDPPVPILHDITLSAQAGEVVALLGSSGAGKTTLLRCLNGLAPIRKGTIEIYGEAVGGIDPVKLRLSIGYVVQGAALFPHWTVGENVATVPRLLGWDPERTAEEVDRALDLVHLAPQEFRDRFPQSLSGGQQQRAGVARALVAKPRLVLMDEPFGALDPLTRENLQADFLELQRDLGFTVVVVTHDVSEAVLLADRMAILSQGRLVQEGTPQSILRDPANEAVEQMLHAPRRKAEIWRTALGA